MSEKEREIQNKYTAEIVKVRKSTKSHVSSSLKNLESRGLIERIQSADNKKHIEIVLLNKAYRIIEDGIKAQKEFAKIALDGLTVEAMIWISAIIISFGCYLPVTLFSKTKPKVGLLMIPKTCAYMWIIAMGLQLLF